MKISYNWLKDYIDIPFHPDQLSEILTDLGLEVEGLEEVESVKGGLKGVIVGEVKTCGPHPNADRLSVCTVDVGKEELLHIVCGAPNVAVGQKVFVATVGTILYGKEGEAWKIKKGKIRGEVSEGMICAEDELGLGDDHDGIMVLDSKTPVGTAAANYLDISTDYVFDIGLTPNRSDATGHIGVAKDVLAYLRVNGNPDQKLKPIPFDIDFGHATEFKVDILNEEACPRYSALILSGIEVKESPKWMKERLESIGVRAINNIVDITNYVLHEYGQPLHAFDADKIAEKHVKVQTLAEGTPFTTLDEQERTLSVSDLMICDGNDNPMCIGGVFGGIGTGVTASTKNIFLESAYFDPTWIRRTSTRHLLPTDAAKCFEKGCDPNNTIDALKRAASLMVEYASATISSSLIDNFPQEIKASEVFLRYQQVEKLIGVKLGAEQIKQILHALEMEIVEESSKGITVAVPTNKFDVTREADLIEEILRIYGYNTVPINDVLHSALSYRKHPDPVELREQCANLLSNLGFLEMMALSLTNHKKTKEVFGYTEEDLVFINNTSNINLDTMRPHMLISALEVALYNQNRQQQNLRMYEFGKVYRVVKEERKEEEMLSILISGDQHNLNWSKSPESVSYFSIKKYVEIILQKLGINSYSSENLRQESYFTYGQSISRGPIQLVTFGLVSKEICQHLGIKNEIYFAQFHWQNILKVIGKGKLFVEEISKFPSTRRDLALVMDEDVPFAAIQRIAGKVGKKLVKEVSLFDVYRQDEHLGKGKKSYAISLLFEDANATLKDKQVDGIINLLLKKLSSELNVQLR